MDNSQIIVRPLGLSDYEPVWLAMKRFTDERKPETLDELWIVQHPPVFTQGQAGKAEHLLNTGDIPVIQVDRGGQVTYHGPGQLVAYPLIDLRRRGIGVRELVSKTEEAIINTLSDIGIEAFAKPDAPGVYVGQGKIASLGFRIRRGCSYHGLSLNVSMDTGAFFRINPCGFAGMEMLRTQDLSTDPSAGDVNAMAGILVAAFTRALGYQTYTYKEADVTPADGGVSAPVLASTDMQAG